MMPLVPTPSALNSTIGVWQTCFWGMLRSATSASSRCRSVTPKAMEHLFDPFFSTKESGMGMGLAISQTIMSNHHGKIKADSWPGRGSTFTIELPPSVEAAVSAAS